MWRHLRQENALFARTSIFLSHFIFPSDTSQTLKNVFFTTTSAAAKENSKKRLSVWVKREWSKSHADITFYTYFEENRWENVIFKYFSYDLFLRLFFLFLEKCKILENNQRKYYQESQKSYQKVNFETNKNKKKLRTCAVHFSLNYHIFYV